MRSTRGWSLAVTLAGTLLVASVAGCKSSEPSGSGSETKAVAPKLELRLSGPETVKVGQPVPIRIEVANVGKVSAEFASDSGDREHRGLHVVTPEGVDREFAGMSSKDILVHSERLAPGESKVVESGFDLAKAFDLTKPGTYKVQVRRVKLAPDLEAVDSNEVSIHIE